MRSEAARTGRCTRATRRGKRCPIAIPAAIGSPSSSATASSMSSGSSDTARRIAAVGSYIPAHSARFSGVITIATAVDTAVIDTDSAVLPRA